jgi:hypothetical protein
MWFPIDAANSIRKNGCPAFGKKVGQKMGERMVEPIARRETIKILHE